MIGDDIGDLAAPGHLIAGHIGPGPIGADDHPGGQALFLSACFFAVDHMRAIRVAFDADISAGNPFRPGPHRPDPQKFIEILAVDHPDIAILDRNIDAPPGG